MIHPEGRMGELFATLPALSYKGKDYPPIYSFGTQKDLYKFLNMKRKEVSSTGTGNIYPIIWLETPITPKGSNNRVSFKMELITAVLTTSAMTNEQRLADSFKLQLVPLFEDIMTALKRSGFTEILRERGRISEEYIETTKYFNYGTSTDDDHQTTDIWDAMKIGLDIAMTDQCLRTFNY